MHLARYPLSVGQGEVLHHVFAENTIERPVWERKWSTEVNQEAHILIAKPVDIHPVSIVKPSRAGAQVQEERAWPTGQSFANSRFLPSERIPDSDSKKMKIPPRNGQKAVTEKQQQEVTQWISSAGERVSSQSSEATNCSFDPLIAG